MGLLMYKQRVGEYPHTTKEDCFYISNGAHLHGSQYNLGQKFRFRYKLKYNYSKAEMTHKLFEGTNYIFFFKGKKIHIFQDCYQ